MSLGRRRGWILCFFTRRWFQCHFRCNQNCQFEIQVSNILSPLNFLLRIRLNCQQSFLLPNFVPQFGLSKFIILHSVHFLQRNLSKKNQSSLSYNFSSKFRNKLHQNNLHTFMNNPTTNLKYLPA